LKALAGMQEQLHAGAATYDITRTHRHRSF